MQRFQEDKCDGHAEKKIKEIFGKKAISSKNDNKRKDKRYFNGRMITEETTQMKTEKRILQKNMGKPVRLKSELKTTNIRRNKTAKPDKIFIKMLRVLIKIILESVYTGTIFFNIM